MELVVKLDNVDETLCSLPPNNKRNKIQSNPKLMVAPKRAKLVAKSNHNITEKALQELHEISTKLDETPEHNKFECFVKTIACMLKTFPEELALESMSHIQSYLAQILIIIKQKHVNQVYM